MNFLRHLTAALAAASFAGCATTDLVGAPVCTDGVDCTAKWDAAQQWVIKNADFKLETATSNLLETYGPVRVGGAGPMLLAASVTRKPDGLNRFRIVAAIGCGNPFGCTTDPATALADFNRTVSAAN